MKAPPGERTGLHRVAGLCLLAIQAACGPGDTDVPPAADAPDASTDDAFVAPRDTDILLADLRRASSGLPSLGEPTNVTARADYDNQPHFLPDGGGFWYTAVESHTGQSDIYRYDIAEGRVARVTSSNPESEYSATPLPDGTGISVVRVEADSTQRLWRFDADGANPSVLLQDVAPVGYHAWIDETTVALFVLGEPPTLQVADVRTGRARVVARDIGRSLQAIPGTFDVSYVQRHADGTSTIMRLPGDGGDPSPIVDAVGGGDFHAWTPDGTLLMAEGPVIFAAADAEERNWTPVADFSDLNILVSRLAVSPDGSQIAMVAELAPLEAFPGN